MGCAVSIQINQSFTEQSNGLSKIDIPFNQTLDLSKFLALPPIYTDPIALDDNNCNYDEDVMKTPEFHLSSLNTRCSHGYDADNDDANDFDLSKPSKRIGYVTNFEISPYQASLQEQRRRENQTVIDLSLTILSSQIQFLKNRLHSKPLQEADWQLWHQEPVPGAGMFKRQSRKPPNKTI